MKRRQPSLTFTRLPSACGAQSAKKSPKSIWRIWYLEKNGVESLSEQRFSLVTVQNINEISSLISLYS